MRVVADAHFGDVISVTPASLVTQQGPGTVGGARIIHVPGPGDEKASLDPSDDPDAEEAAPDEPLPPRPAGRPRTHNKPAPRREQAVRRPFTSAPPPPAEHRTVLSAPPPAADDGPTPIRPTPRFGEAQGASFAAPIPSTVMPPAAPAPPPAAPAAPAEN